MEKTLRTCPSVWDAAVYTNMGKDDGCMMGCNSVLNTVISSAEHIQILKLL